ncbi:MAG: phage tail spike protein [Peptostreptococcaceae bacterium]
MSKNIKISLFDKTASKEDVIANNGIALDRFCLNYTIEEDFNNCILDAVFVHDVDNKITDDIEEESIIKARFNNRYEYFVVSKVERTTRRITIVARHITIQRLLACYLDDVRPTKLSATSFLNYIYTNSFNGNRAKDITFITNLNGDGTSYFVDKNVHEAIYSSDNSFINHFGGETKRTGYTLTIKDRIGSDNGVTIMERKNLLGFESNTNLDSIATRVRMKGFNGILGDWKESPLMNTYVSVFSKTFDCNVRLRVEGEEDQGGYEYFDTLEQCKARMNILAEELFSKSNVDKIKATYNINFIQLEKTEEYKNYVQAERLDLGDTVRVYVPSLKQDINVRVVSIKYNGMSDEISDMKLSNYAINSAISRDKLLLDLEKKIGEGGQANVGEYIAAILSAGMQDSHVIVRQNEIIIGDTNDINTMRNCWRWNKGALAHSSTGYYSNEWNIGILQTGEINADIIRTGVLSAIMLKSLDGKNWIDLSTGEINFTKGKIVGNNIEIDLNTGVIKFKSGLISGSNMEINLDTGVIKTINDINPTYIKEAILSGGELMSNEYLSLYGEKGVNIAHGRLGGDSGSFGAYDWGASVTGKKINILAGNQPGDIINMIANEVNINGSPITRQVATLENALLQKEGII